MPNQGVPVIFKNKIAYGYAEQSVKAYDMSVSDYNALTEAQQLDGSIRLIQGVDATPNGSNIWAKIGTTPLAEELPRDCSQAINQLKSDLTDLETVTSSTSNSITFVKCGKQRQAIFDWATTSNIKSFFTNLSNDDKPIYTLVANTLRVDGSNGNYATLAFLRYDNGTTSIYKYASYNANSGATDSSGTDLHKGQIVWFVN